MEFIFSVAAVCDLQSTILKGILKQTAVLLTNKIYVKVNSRKIINVLVTSKRNKASKPSIKKNVGKFTNPLQQPKFLSEKRMSFRYDN
jgi:hypothetical protein